MKSLNYFFSTILFLGLVGCGKDSGGGGSSQSESPNHRELTEATPGTYYTVLRPVNIRSNGFIPYGMATFTLKDDQLQVNVSVDDDQPVVHRQSLHLGTRCPTLKDDTNGDGFIDYNEAQKVVGPILMPLDSDLNSQKAGESLYPKGPAMTYSRVASLQNVNADLWTKDEDPSDEVMKLARGKGIGFSGRVVLVHGTTHQNFFPASLASHKNEQAHLSLPVVCGLLEKID